MQKIIFTGPPPSAAYQKHLSSLGSCFVVPLASDNKSRREAEKKASSLLTLPSALGRYINKRNMYDVCAVYIKYI